MYLLFCRHFCVKMQKILTQSLLLTLPKQLPAECKQIEIPKNVTIQGHIHANPKKNPLKKFFSTWHLIKIPLNGLTYNPAEHFTRFSHFSSPFQVSEKYIRNS